MLVAFPRRGHIEFQDWVDFEEGQQTGDTRRYVEKGVDFICLPSESPSELMPVDYWNAQVEALQLAFCSCLRK